MIGQAKLARLSRNAVNHAAPLILIGWPEINGAIGWSQQRSEQKA